MSIRPVRRVVTHHTPSGEATVLADGDAPEVMEVAGWPGLGVTELWSTDECPVDLDQPGDRARPMRHDPSPQGTIFRVVQIPPEGSASIDADAAFADMGSRNRPDEDAKSKHPSMHRTDSIDFITVISGEMTMLMGDGTKVVLRQGDCIIQQGTDHAWINHSGEPCVISAVLIDASTPRALDGQER